MPVDKTSPNWRSSGFVTVSPCVPFSHYVINKDLKLTISVLPLLTVKLDNLGYGRLVPRPLKSPKNYGCQVPSTK